MKKIKNKYFSILIKMSFPILMNYVVMTLFEVLDKAIVGNYSTYDLAAVGVGATVIYGITGTLGVISVAYNIIAAQCLGKDNRSEFNNTFSTVMFISLIVGVAIILLCLFSGKLLFSVVFGLEGDILKICLEYFHIASVTVILNMIIFNFSVYFRNLKDTKISFYSTIVSTVINIVFDYLFVFGKFGFPELGASGAAIGSVLGLLAGVVVYLVKFHIYRNKKDKGVISKKITCKLIKLYIPLLGQDFVEGTIFTVILTGIVSRIGVYEVAAYNLVESVGSIMALPIYAFSASAITLSIQKSFTTKKENPRSILNASIILSFFMILIMGILVTIFHGDVFGLMTKDETLILGVNRIFILVIIMQVCNIFHQIYKSYLQGVDEENYVLKITGAISIISIAWILILSMNFGLVGIYMGLIINNLLFAVVYYLKIKSIDFTKNLKAFNE